MFLGKMKWRRDEPEPLPPEKATWLKQAVHRCLAEGFITVEEGERILGEKLETESGPAMLRRKAFLKLPLEERRRILEAQAEKLQERYEKEEDWSSTESDDFDEHK
jgi:hypothetical protein